MSSKAQQRTDSADAFNEHNNDASIWLPPLHDMQLRLNVQRAHFLGLSMSEGFRGHSQHPMLTRSTIHH